MANFGQAGGPSWARVVKVTMNKGTLVMDGPLLLHVHRSGHREQGSIKKLHDTNLRATKITGQ
jgi:hypothetical protein